MDREDSQYTDFDVPEIDVSFGCINRIVFYGVGALVFLAFMAAGCWPVAASEAHDYPRLVPQSMVEHLQPVPARRIEPASFRTVERVDWCSLSQEQVAKEVARQAYFEHVPPALAVAIVDRESGLRACVGYGDGGKAIGLFQLHAAAAQDAGGGDRYDPSDNIRMGLRYLRWLYEITGSWGAAIVANNGGIGNLQRGVVSPQALEYHAHVSRNAMTIFNHYGHRYLPVTGGLDV